MLGTVIFLETSQIAAVNAHTYHVIWRVFVSQSDWADVQAQKEQIQQNK